MKQLATRAVEVSTNSLHGLRLYNKSYCDRVKITTKIN